MKKLFFALLSVLCVPQFAFAAISYVASCTPGTNSCTMPAHQVGDMIICFAGRDGSNTPPTVPTGSGYASITSGGGNSVSAVAGYLIADTTGEVSGTWTNATSTICSVYRGTASPTAVGGSNTANGSSATVTYPSLSMTVGDGTSWVFEGCEHRSTNTDLDTVIGDIFTFRAGVSDATDDAGVGDSNTGVASYAGGTHATGGSSSGFECISVEILAPSTFTPVDPFGQSGFFGL